VSKARYVQSFGGDSALFAAAFASAFVSTFAPIFPAALVFANVSAAAAFPAVPASVFIFIK
jgi:hypothetical protein